MKLHLALTIVSCFLISFTLPTTLAVQRCGPKFGACQNGTCCSVEGWCGTDDVHCCYCAGCQLPYGTCEFCYNPPTDDVRQLISKPGFDKMLLHRNHSPHCADGYYTYEAFITAAKSFPSFATTGSMETRRREIGAFLAHTLHGATGHWRTENDAVNHFKTAISFWMSPESSKPSYHLLVTKIWNFTSSFADDE